MKRTSASTLLILAVVGGASMSLVQVALASSGRPIVTAPVTLPLALAAIGAIVVSLAIPIRRMTRGLSQDSARPTAPAGPVDPFYATRIVMLAKASALSGALLTGAGAGMIGYLLTRSVLPGVGSIAATVAAAVGAAVLLACGLVAESMCRVPPSNDDDDDDDERPARARS